MGFLLLLFAVHRKIVSINVRVFFRQNIVNSRLTGELYVGTVRQKIEQRFDLTFKLHPQHGSKSLAISHTSICHTLEVLIIHV